MAAETLGIRGKPELGSSGSWAYSHLVKRGVVLSWTKWFKKWLYLVISHPYEFVLVRWPRAAANPQDSTALSAADWHQPKHTSNVQAEQKSQISRIQGKIAGEFPLDSFWLVGWFTVAVSPFCAGIQNRDCQNTVKTAIQSGSHNRGRNSRILCQISAEASVWYKRPIQPSADRRRLSPNAPAARAAPPPRPAAAVTCRMLYRCTSQKSRTPISVPMYQPLKGHAVNSRPPTSRSMLATAGSAYHFRSSSLNHSYLSSKHLDLLLYVCFLL